jgi:hypothetical protein
LVVGGFAWRLAQRKSKLATEKNTNQSAARKLLD